MSDSRSGFASLGLPEVLLTAIARQGFEQPSPIQAQAIPLLLDGHKRLRLHCPFWPAWIRLCVNRRC